MAGFTPIRDWRRRRVLWLPVLFAALGVAAAASSGLDDDGTRVVLAVPTNLSTGFAEEAAFRGIILFVLLRAWGADLAGVLRAVLVSSALFRLLHLSNLSPAGQEVLQVLNQVLYAGLFGIAFAALRLRVNSISPLIAIHTALNLAGGITEQGTASAFTLAEAVALTLPTVILAAYGLYLLRRSVAQPLDAASTPLAATR